MKKYMILAALPMLMLGGQLYAEAAESKYKELNEIIKDELGAAQKAMHSNTKPELEATVDDLCSYSQKGGQKRQVAIDYLVLIQKAVQECKDTQYVTWWHKNFGSFIWGDPTALATETISALTLIKAKLDKIGARPEEIGTANSNIPLIAAAIGAAVVVGGGLGIVGYKWWNSDSGAALLEQMDRHNYNSLTFTVENVSGYWSMIVVESACKDNSLSSNGEEYDFILEETQKFAMNKLNSVKPLAFCNPIASEYDVDTATRVKKEVVEKAYSLAKEYVDKPAKNSTASPISSTPGASDGGDDETVWYENPLHHNNKVSAAKIAK